MDFRTKLIGATRERQPSTWRAATTISARRPTLVACRASRSIRRPPPRRKCVADRVPRCYILDIVPQRPWRVPLTLQACQCTILATPRAPTLFQPVGLARSAPPFVFCRCNCPQVLAACYMSFDFPWNWKLCFPRARSRRRECASIHVYLRLVSFPAPRSVKRTQAGLNPVTCRGSDGGREGEGGKGRKRKRGGRGKGGRVKEGEGAPLRAHILAGQAGPDSVTRLANKFAASGVNGSPAAPAVRRRRLGDGQRPH